MDKWKRIRNILIIISIVILIFGLIISNRFSGGIISNMKFNFVDMKIEDVMETGFKTSAAIVSLFILGFHILAIVFIWLMYFVMYASHKDDDIE